MRQGDDDAGALETKAMNRFITVDSFQVGTCEQ